MEQINLGNYANDGTGDDLLTAFRKVNSNFTELGASDVRNGLNLGAGTVIFAQRNNNAELEFKTLTSTDNSVTITHDANTVNLTALANVEGDTSPMLGGNLGLNGYTIKMINGGGIESNIYGISIPLLNSLVELLLTSNQLNINMGDFISDIVDTDLDMGELAGIYNFSNNNLDFGPIELPQ